MVLSSNVVDPPPVRIIADPKVQVDSVGRFVQPSCTGWLNPFTGETFTITLAISPTLTVSGDVVIAKLAGVAGCDGDTTSAIAAETLPFVAVSPA